MPIAYPQSVDPDQACVVELALGIAFGSRQSPLPPGYRLCVWTTSIKLQQKSCSGGASPRVYVMQALPEQLTLAICQSGCSFVDLNLSVEFIVETSVIGNTFFGVDVSGLGSRLNFVDEYPIRTAHRIWTACSKSLRLVNDLMVWKLDT